MNKQSSTTCTDKATGRKSGRLEIRISPADLAGLDAARGGRTRAEFVTHAIRALIAGERIAATGAELRRRMREVESGRRQFFVSQIDAARRAR